MPRPCGSSLRVPVPARTDPVHGLVASGCSVGWGRGSAARSTAMWDTGGWDGRDTGSQGLWDRRAVGARGRGLLRAVGMQGPGTPGPCDSGVGGARECRTQGRRDPRDLGSCTCGIPRMRDPRDVESHGCGTPGTRDRGAEDPGTRGPRPGRRVPPVGAVSGRPAPWPVPPPAARPPRPGQRRRAALPRARGRHGPAAAARRCLPRLHPRHVRDRPVGPAPDGHNTERGEHPVPALPHHRREQPELAGLRLPEAGLDADRGEHHRRRAADPLHPGVLLLQPRQAVGAAAEPGAAGGAGCRLLLLQPAGAGRGHPPGAAGALLQPLHHQHVPLAAGRPGQDPPDQVDALPVLPADGHHLPGLRQLDAVRRAAPRPVHHGPQRAGDRHQRPAVLAVLAVPAGPGQALPPSARVSETTGGPAGAPGRWALPPTKARGRAARGLGPSGRSSPTAQGLGAAGLLPALPPCAHRLPRAPGPSTLLPTAGVHPQRGVWGAGASCPSFVWI